MSNLVLSTSINVLGEDERLMNQGFEDEAATQISIINS